MTASIFAAFFLGVFGSLHCVGMCGPLAIGLAAPGGRTAQLYALLRYHAGRICTYTMGGLLFGWLGRRIVIAGWQQGFSIGLGLSVLVFSGIRHWAPSALHASALVQRTMAHIWRMASGKGGFLLGMANGLLPCGMVYLAIAGALTRPNALQAMTFMASFGAGTLPLLLGLQWAGHMLPAANRLRLRKALPVVTVVVAVLLILRGLDLGIPFISPMLPSSPGRPVSCH